MVQAQRIPRSEGIDAVLRREHEHDEKDRGDNHGDTGLAKEIAGHAAGVGSIAKMMQGLTAANLQDKVTFVMSNVFGRTMVHGFNANGRQHNDRWPGLSRRPEPVQNRQLH